jgi:hypothetical protein
MSHFNVHSPFDLPFFHMSFFFISIVLTYFYGPIVTNEKIEKHEIHNSFSFVFTDSIQKITNSKLSRIATSSKIGSQ